MEYHLEKALVQLNEDKGGTSFSDVTIFDDWIHVENTFIPRERVHAISHYEEGIDDFRVDR